MDLQSEISAKRNRELIGETVEVLVDGPSKKDKSKLAGRSRTHKIVIFKGDKNLTGEIVNVMINEAQSWTLFGELVE